MNSDKTVPISPSKKFRGRLARTTLAIILPMTLLPILILGWATYNRSSNLVRELITGQVSTAVETHASQMAAYTQQKEAFMDRLMARRTFTFPINTAASISHDSPSFRGVRTELIGEFEAASALEVERYFDQFIIVSQQGVILVSSNPIWETLSIKGTYLEEIMVLEKSFALYNTAPLYSNRLLFFTAKPFLNSQGETVAMVVGITESQAARRELETSMVIHKDAWAYYYTKDGFFISLTPNLTTLTVFEPTPEQKIALLPVLLQDSTEGASSQFPSRQNEPVYAYAKMVPGLDLGLVIEVPREALLQPLYVLAPYTIVIVTVTIVLLGFLIWQGTTRLVKPLVALSDTTRRFSEGEWQQRATVRRNDEIGLLAYSFNQMADELTMLYRSLEGKVEERTRQIRTAAAVAQVATSAPSLRELLRRTVTLLVERFGYYDASIFLIDDTGTQAVLTEYAGVDVSSARKPRDLRLAVGSRSIIGWVSSHKQSRVSADVNEDPLFLKDENLPETRSEAVLPIAIGDNLLGVLDVQHSRTGAFGPDDVAVLQTLANQIATAIQNIRLLEATQVNLEEASLLYHASRQITQAGTRDEILKVAAEALAQTSYASSVLDAESSGMRRITTGEAGSNLRMPVHPLELRSLIPAGSPLVTFDAAHKSQIPPALLDALDLWKCETIAILPILQGEELVAALVLGSEDKESMSSTLLRPFANLAELISTAMNKVVAEQNIEKRLNELQALNQVGQAISAQTDPLSLYEVIHEATAQIIGDLNFLIALYDPGSQQIQIPYFYDGEKVTRLDPFPLGEGLTSILLKSRQPLLLNKMNEEKIRELGAKIVGAPARSWLGVPLIVGGEATGALIVQDLENEDRFTEADLRILSTLASQVAVAIRNTRLLEQTRQLADRERLLHEATSRIRNSIDMRNILATTATELGRALGARKAKIELHLSETNLPEGMEKEKVA